MKNTSYFNLLNVTIVGSSASGFVCMSLVDASIKSLLLLALATVAALTLVRASAATRHMIWGTTMIGLLLMPACALLLPQWRVLPSWFSLESRFEQQSPISEPFVYNAPASDGPVETETHFAPDPAQYETTSLPNIPDAIVPVESTVSPTVIRLSAFAIVGIWAAGFSLCLLPVVFAFLRLLYTERILRHNPPLSNRIVRRIATLAKELGVKPPHILVGPPGAMPMVWSLASSRMLLPIDIEHWSANRIKSVLLHELVHLKRRDPTWFLVGLLARAVNWFNPLVWYAVRRLRLECERACNDHVLRMGVEASEYASHLLALSTSVRATSGTGSMALAMASKPSVENRIVSILDAKRNRCAVTLRRASAMLFTVTAGVAVMATLAATGSNKTIANDPTSIVQDEAVAIKYPHCLVEVENLKPRSLAEAIATFNRESLESPTGSAQAPITEQETFVAISEFVKLEHVPDSTKAAFREIAETKTVPSNAYFRRFTRFDDEQQMHGVWCVRLYLEGTNPLVYSVPIRTTELFKRPYTQLERKQNAEGITLLNRFTSYFEAAPTKGANEVITDNIRLIGAFQRAVLANKLDDAMELYHWQGADDSIRNFVSSELKTLLKARALSIKIEPRTLDGKLVHWSAYQHYQPNLPVIGYMHIEYTPQAEVANAKESTGSLLLDQGDILGVLIKGVLPYEGTPKIPTPNDPDGNSQQPEKGPSYPIFVQEDGTIALPSIKPISVKGKSIDQTIELINGSYLDARIFNSMAGRTQIVKVIKRRLAFPTKTLSLELGKLGEELRFINYVALGDRKLPEGPIAGLSTRGSMEKLADGTYLQTEVISNPGSLISGHLANEEIRQRDLENTKWNVEKNDLAIRGQHEKPSDAQDKYRDQVRKREISRVRFDKLLRWLRVVVELAK
jgi:beta-lactamase regulating signal transducer with metallopeptidase domain